MSIISNIRSLFGAKNKEDNAVPNVGIVVNCEKYI